MRLNNRCGDYTLILAPTFSIYNYKIAMATFGAKFLDTINWSETHNCEIGKYFHLNFDNTRVKVFPNLTGRHYTHTNLRQVVVETLKCAFLWGDLT